MSETRQGNLITALLNEEVNFIFHCCNCQNNFGSGIAKEIKERIPEAYEEDTVAHKSSEGDLLGDFSLGGNVFNLYGQEFYGRFGDHYKVTGRQVHYGAYIAALARALNTLHKVHVQNTPIKPHDITLGFPHLIASDRAGGDWNTIRELTEYYVEAYGFDLVWYKL